MADIDKKKTAVETEAVASTSPVEEKESQEVSPTEGGEVQPQEAQPTETQEVEKPTRLEKRVKSLEEKKAGIDELLSKLKSGQDVQQKDVPSWMMEGKEPLIKPEELQEGIDPAELERRIQSRLERAKQEAVREATQQMQYQNLIAEHYHDVQTAIERFPELNKNNKETYDPDFEAEVVRLYNLYNTVYNPITNGKEFVPAVKLSEVYKEVKGKWEKIMTRKMAQAKETLVSQVSSSAIPPSSSAGETEPSVEDLRKNIWNNPQEVAKALAKKLKVEE